MAILQMVADNLMKIHLQLYNFLIEEVSLSN